MGYGINDMGTQYCTPLMHAAQWGYENVVTYLLTLGPELEVEDWDGRTALMLAVRGKHMGIAMRLLEAGADPNHREEYGHTPLNMACHYGQASVLDEMLKRGGKVHLKSLLHEETALGLATFNLDRLVRNPGCFDGASVEGLKRCIALLKEHGAEA